MDQSAQIHDADFLPFHLERADRKAPDRCQLQAALVEIDRAGGEWRVAQRETHLPNERPMDQRREGAGVDHELRRLSVERAVDVKIPAFRYADRHAAPAVVIYPWDRPRRFRID